MHTGTDMRPALARASTTRHTQGRHRSLPRSMNPLFALRLALCLGLLLLFVLDDLPAPTEGVSG